MTWLPNIGWPELLVILAVALALFGASRLPEVGRDLGRASRGFKEALAKESQDTAEGEPPRALESSDH